MNSTSSSRSAKSRGRARSSKGSALGRQDARSIYDVDMTAADAPQEFVVERSSGYELERRGVHVHAGDRVQLQLVP